MSHENGSSAFVFQVIGIIKQVNLSTDKVLQLSYSPMVCCNSLYGSNFDFRMTYFASWLPRTKLCHFGPGERSELGSYSEGHLFFRTFLAEIGTWLDSNRLDLQGQ